MIRKIIYTKPDGTVAVVHPVRNSVGDEKLTDEEIEQRAWRRLPAGILTPMFVDPSVIPADRSYRNAWRQDGASIRVDEVAKTFLDANKPLSLQEELASLKNRIAVLEKR